MSITCFKFSPIAIVVLGTLLGSFLLNPLCYAGGAVKLVPAEEIDMPEGSNIPERRTKEVEKKVTEFKAKMKEKSTEKQQEQLPQDKMPESEAPEE